MTSKSPNVLAYPTCDESALQTRLLPGDEFYILNDLPGDSSTSIPLQIPQIGNNVSDEYEILNLVEQYLEAGNSILSYNEILTTAQNFFKDAHRAQTFFHNGVKDIWEQWIINGKKVDAKTAQRIYALRAALEKKAWDIFGAPGSVVKYATKAGTSLNEIYRKALYHFKLTSQQPPAKVNPLTRATLKPETLFETVNGSTPRFAKTNTSLSSLVEKGHKIINSKALKNLNKGLGYFTLGIPVAIEGIELIKAETDEQRNKALKGIGRELFSGVSSHAASYLSGSLCITFLLTPASVVGYLGCGLVSFGVGYASGHAAKTIYDESFKISDKFNSKAGKFYNDMDQTIYNLYYNRYGI